MRVQGLELCIYMCCERTLGRGCFDAKLEKKKRESEKEKFACDCCRANGFIKSSRGTRKAISVSMEIKMSGVIYARIMRSLWKRALYNYFQMNFVIVRSTRARMY